MTVREAMVRTFGPSTMTPTPDRIISNISARAY